MVRAEGWPQGDSDVARVESLTVLSRFRTEFHVCPTARKDVLFELADAILRSDGPVKDPGRACLGARTPPRTWRLCTGPQSRRDRRKPTAASPGFRAVADGGRWPPGPGGGRTGVASPGRGHRPPTGAFATYGFGENKHLMIPGWPYSIVAALETGQTSSTAVPDAVRLVPGARCRRHRHQRPAAAPDGDDPGQGGRRGPGARN